MTPATRALPGSERRSFALPLIVNEGNKIRYGWSMAFVAAALYLPANHFHFVEPIHLPLAPIDQLMPFLPYTVWIYLSEIPLFITAYVVCKSALNLNRYYYSFLFLQVVSVAIFWIWPTTYPRDQFPLPDTLDPVTHFLFSNLRLADTPANCAPSLHVSSVYLTAFVYLEEQRKKFPLFFGWATAVAISTLSTKQHYLVDVVSGIVLAGFCYIFFRYMPYRTVKS